MLIAFLTNDLVFPSRVAGLAQRLGAEMQTAISADVLVAKLTNETLPGVVLLDLNSPGVDPAAVVPRLKSLANSPRAIVAFGPHVHEERLAAAKAAGCDVVLTRGQFDAQMVALLTELLNSSASS